MLPAQFGKIITMKITSAVLIVLLLISGTVNAGVVVMPVTALEAVTTSYTVNPGGYVAIPLPALSGEKNAYKITINVSNSVYKDITAYFVDEENMRLFTQHTNYKGIGVSRKVAPFSIDAVTETVGQHYLILDNTYALIIAKKIAVTVQLAYPMTEREKIAYSAQFTAMYNALKKVFVVTDFNIIVKPCGQVNAFSESTTTGNIGFCTELVDHLAKSRNDGAFFFIFFHEVGHSLLGLWGVPGNNNEDFADEFATYIMMQNERGPELLMSALEFWQEKDSKAEAQNIIQNGDRHSLSVQRIRNIKENLNNQKSFSTRWNNLLYPHMTQEALSQFISNPTASSDTVLAKSILKRLKSDEVLTEKEDEKHVDSVPVTVVNDLVGKWVGTYICQQNLTYAEIDIDENLNVMFRLSAQDSPSGAFDGYFKGKIEVLGSNVTFRPLGKKIDGWKNVPKGGGQGWITVGFDATLSQDDRVLEGVIQNPQCTSIRLETQR